MLSGNGFEAGLEAPEGNLVGVTDLREMINLLFRNTLTGHNDLRDGLIFKDLFYGIERPKNRIAIHLLALVSKIVIDKANWLQSQGWIIKKLIQGIPPVGKGLYYSLRLKSRNVTNFGRGESRIRGS